MSNVLHVHNGDSAAGTLRRSNLGGTILAYADVLHEGPVPAGLDDSELREVRARFIGGGDYGTPDEILSQLQEMDATLERLPEYDEVVLWFEHDLYDQLQLVDALALAHTQEGAPELIVIGSFPGKPSFAGLGELTARELETLWPSHPCDARRARCGDKRLGRPPGAGAHRTMQEGDA